MAESDPPPRWSRWFGHAAEPIFLLNRRRRLVFVNDAFCQLTGFGFPELKGQPCRRRARTVLVDRLEQVLAVLAPPPEVMQGEPASRRVQLPLPSGAELWVQTAFFPFQGADGVLGVLGKIHRLPAPPAGGALPLAEKLLALRDQGRPNLSFLELPSLHLQRVVQQVRLAAPVSAPVLVVGPPGSGKHWLARILHQASPRREQFFACLDCARLPPAAMAETLFAAPGRQPPLGTVYLKEPERLPRDWQLRLVQHWQSEAEETGLPRLIVGATEDPELGLASSPWLPELYGLVSAITIRLPALRERGEDLPLLVESMLQRARTVGHSKVESLNPECWEILRQHSWPGNLRELAQVLLGACRRAKGAQLEAADLPLYLRSPAPPPERKLALDPLLEQVEKRMLNLALRLAQGNKKKAADLLEIWRPRLLRRLEALGLAGPDVQPG